MTSGGTTTKERARDDLNKIHETAQNGLDALRDDDPEVAKYAFRAILFRAGEWEEQGGEEE